MVWLKFAAAMLASSLRALLGKLNEAMGLGIGIAVEVVANVEAEIPGFLFDLRRDHGRHRAGIHLAGDLGAQVIDDFEPPHIGNPSTWRFQLGRLGDYRILKDNDSRGLIQVPDSK